MGWWQQTCRTWPSGVTFNKLVSSSCIEDRDNYVMAVFIYICIWALFLTFEMAYMAHGGSMWSLRGPHSQDDKPEKRQLSWRFKRDKIQRACLGTWSMASNAILTISRHHTHRLPAKDLIFLRQTWHLLELLSVRIQSWAATWDAEEWKVDKENVHVFSSSADPWPPWCQCQSSIAASWLIFFFFDSAVLFLTKQGQRRHYVIGWHRLLIVHTSSHWHIYYAKEAEKMRTVICSVPQNLFTITAQKWDI